jgi:DNA repair exonuclease SbcCD nuclease subunit
MSFKVLRIGDPHVKVNNLEEMDAFMSWLSEVIMKENPDRLEILGDLFHTHAILRVEVIDFWNHWLDHLSDLVETVVLVGNHDMASASNDSLNALSVFSRMRKKNLKIIELPRVEGIFAYVPYIHDRNRFCDLANGLASGEARVLVCHQTFSGSRYENGFYAPDGIDPALINFDLIISGHIHSRQRFGKVIYPGTFKWDTNADANEEKGIWLVEHDDSTGKILSERFIDSSHVCKPIVSLTWIEGEEAPTVVEGSRTLVELVGSSDWIAKQKDVLRGKAAVTTKITDRSNKVSRQLYGADLEDFVKNLFVTSANREALLKYAKELNVL